MPIQFHINKPTHVIVHLTPGKPNPKLPVEIVGPQDNRARVAMKAGHYPHTWRYAQKLLSTDIGLVAENLPADIKSDLLERRKVEKELSGLRKKINQMQAEYDTSLQRSAIGQISFSTRSHDFRCVKLDEFTKEKAQLDKELAIKKEVALLKTIKTLGLTDAWVRYKEELVRKMLKVKFANTHPNIIGNEEAFNTYCIQNKGSVDPMIRANNRVIANAFLFLQTSKMFKLQESTWTPDMSITDVIALIKEQGPFLVSSTTSCVGAKINHELCSQINGYMHKSIIEGEAIQNACTAAYVVIGARNDQKAQKIYFINPADGSNPNDVTVQTIYSADFNHFVASVVNFSNIELKTNNGERLDAGFAYGMYQPLYQHASSALTVEQAVSSLHLSSSDEHDPMTEDKSLEGEEDWEMVDYDESAESFSGPKA